MTAIARRLPWLGQDEGDERGAGGGGLTGHGQTEKGLLGHGENFGFYPE